jgi:hypothetical protein
MAIKFSSKFKETEPLCFIKDTRNITNITYDINIKELKKVWTNYKLYVNHLWNKWTFICSKINFADEVIKND